MKQRNQTPIILLLDLLLLNKAVLGMDNLCSYHCCFLFLFIYFIFLIFFLKYGFSIK